MEDNFREDDATPEFSFEVAQGFVEAMEEWTEWWREHGEDVLRQDIKNFFE